MDDQDFLLPVSVFDNKDDNRPSPQEVGWHAFAQRLCRYDERTTKDGKAWSPVTYKPGTTRGKHNVEMVHALVLDIDHQPLPLDLLDGRELAAHTTFQHTAEDPRWRAALPLLRPVSGADWPEFWLRANAHFGGCVDPATKDSSRIFYLPSCPPGGVHETRVQHGRLLDPDELPEVPVYTPTPRPTGKKKQGVFKQGLAEWAQRFSVVKTAELASMPRDSGRNAACNRLAHTLGGLMAEPMHDLQAEWVVDTLLDACHQNGLIREDGERSVRATIRSGLESGLMRAWSPADLDPPSPTPIHSHRNSSAPTSPGLADLQMASTIEPEEIRWLWQGWLAQGKLAVLLGDPGLGKSLLSIHCTSVVSNGSAWPDGQPCEQGGVIILSAEDGPADTIRPRLDAAGADVTKVFLLHGVRDDPNDTSSRMVRLQSDIATLEQAIEQTHAKLLIVDPLSAYLSGIDSHKAAEVRSILAPLAAMADRTRVAVLSVLHLNKSGSPNALYRAGGSLDFVAAARLVLGVVPDTERPERRLLVSLKANIAQRPDGLGYQVVSSTLGRVNSPPILRWDHDAVKIDPSRAFEDTTTPEERWQRQAVKEFLVDLLSAGDVPSATVKQEARAAGLTAGDKLLRSVAHDLGIEMPRQGFGPGSYIVWRLPEALRTHRESTSPSITSITSMPSMPIHAIDAIETIGGIGSSRGRTREGNQDLPESLCPIHHKLFSLHDCDQL